ncbi:hypothetical protein EVAR_14368_1 [Eumeta japonica]|uniref:Uncharacterized protein n=1 Tax=Eumeta variegata TaxID=151549 RepID=A0A4C1TXE0_EUMVA|nr:hypothetical protein EVAR_14368_1 [Eumeta japonica]
MLYVIDVTCIITATARQPERTDGSVVESAHRGRCGSRVRVLTDCALNIFPNRIQIGNINFSSHSGDCHRRGDLVLDEWLSLLRKLNKWFDLNHRNYWSSLNSHG